MKKNICHTVAVCLTTLPLMAAAQTTSKSDSSGNARHDSKSSPYIDGGRKNDSSDPYITGGRSDDKFSPYIQGGNKSTRADLSDTGTKAKKGKPASKSADAKQ